MASRPKTSRRDKPRRNSSADTEGVLESHPPPKPPGSPSGPTLLARIRFWLAPVLLLAVLASAYPAWLHYKDWAEFDRARRLIDNWDLVPGMRAAEAYRAKHKTDPAAVLLVARGFRRSDAFNEAEKELKLAEQLGYSKQEIELERLMLTAARGNIEPLLQRVDSPFPLPDYYFGDTCASLASGYVIHLNWNEAIRWLDKWSRVEINQPEPQNRIGAVYFRAVDYDASREMYQRVLKRWPRNRGANLALGDDMIRNNNFQGALDHFQIIIDDDPESASIWRRICLCNLMRGELEMAEEAAERMRPLTLRSGELETDLMLLDLRIALRRTEETRDPKEALRIANEFERYLASRPNDLPARFDYAKALALAGKSKDAEEQRLHHGKMVEALMKAEDLVATIMHKPDDVDSRIKYAQYMAEANDFPIAQQVLQSILARDPFREDALELAVKIFRDSGDPSANQAADELLAAVEAHRKQIGKKPSKDSQVPPNNSESNNSAQ